MNKLFFKINLLTGLILLFILSSCGAQKTNSKLFKEKYIKSVMKKATEWQLDNPKYNPREWTNAAFYAGVFSTWETTKSKTIYQSLMDMGNKEKWLPGEASYHADHHAICQTYIDLYRIEKHREMIQPTIDTLNVFMSNPYPTKGKMDIIKWWWCDALFMGPPALVKLGVTTGNFDLLKANDQYFKECYDLLYNKEEHLFARDNRYIINSDGSGPKEANGELIFWSRGNGWVMAGLVRILQELSKDYPQHPFYENLFKEIAARLVEIQQSDGLWRTSLLDPESYPGGEVSGSGFICYALAWGVNNGLLNKKTYLPVVKKTWIALTNCVNEDGRVGWVQPFAGAPSLRNFNEDSWEVYGTGAFLLAASEVIKLK